MTAQNRIWLGHRRPRPGSACLALLAPAASYETKRRRLRILAVVGRIVTTARRRILKIDFTWPWAEVIITAHTRLCALPLALTIFGEYYGNPDQPVAVQWAWQ